MNRMYRGLHDMWSSTLSLNAIMPTPSSLVASNYSVPFRRSKSVRNLSYDDDDESGQRHLRRIVLRRSPEVGAGLGFSIRGGRELGIGIFVSKVVERSVADRAGLVPGDQILAVNDTSFEDISHEEAIKILKAAPRLHLLVCSTGRVPGACVVHQTYTWLDSEGRTVSPPPEYDHSFYSSPAHRKAVSRLHHAPRIRKVTIRVDKGQSLGLMIRGGVEYGLGVYITGVDLHSVADLANLKVGDQILEVNNQSFLDITHDEAVRMLKYSPHMVMTIREVGKVPYSCTTYDDGDVLAPPRPVGRLLRKGECGMAGMAPGPATMRDNLVHTIDMQALRILNEKAKLVLSKQEMATLSYYRIEYERGQMTIDALVAVLLELFETEDKYALLQDIREVIHPMDLPKFDELIYKKDLEMARTRQRLGPDDRSSRNRFSSVSMDHLTSHVASSPSPRSIRSQRSGLESRAGVGPYYSLSDGDEFGMGGMGEWLPQSGGREPPFSLQMNHVDSARHHQHQQHQHQQHQHQHQHHPQQHTTTAREHQRSAAAAAASRVGRNRRGHQHHYSTLSGDMMGVDDEDLRTPSEDSGVDLANGPYSSPGRVLRDRSESSWHANGSEHRGPTMYRQEEALPPRRGPPRRHGDSGELPLEMGPPRRRTSERRWGIGSDDRQDLMSTAPMEDPYWSSETGAPTPRYPKWRPGRSGSRSSAAYGGRSSSLPRP